MVKFSKRLLCLFLSVIMTISIIIPASASELTGANKRINTFINMAKGEDLTDKDVSDLSKDELRFMGVYLSNFFVPFKTELGVSGENKDSVLDQNKEQMVKALQTNLSFSDDVATGFVEDILGLSRKSVSQTVDKMCYLVKDGENYKKISNVTPNYLNFFNLATGRYDKFMATFNHSSTNSLLDDPSSTAELVKNKVDIYHSMEPDNLKYLQLSEEEYNLAKDIWDSINGDSTKYNKIYMGYGEGENATIVADFYIGENKLSPFQISFLKCLEITESELGWGTNLYDFTVSEISESDMNAKLEELTKRLTKENLLASTVLGRRLAVDCFGNIVVVGANHQLVAIPGCMNPYTWVKVNAQGNDVTKPGEIFNVINAFYMSQNDANLLQNGVSNYIPGSQVAGGSNAANSTMDLKIAKIDGVDSFGQLKIRLEMGSTNSDMGGGDNDYIRDFYALPDSQSVKGFNSATVTYRTLYPKDWTFPYGLGDNGTWSDQPLWNSNCMVLYLANSGSYSSYSTNVKYVDSLVFVDNLGAFEGQDSFNALNVASYIGKEGFSEGSSTLGDMSIFQNKFQDIENGKIYIPETLSEPTLVSLYTTYLFAGMYDSNNKKESIGKLGYRMAIDTLPEIPNSPLKLGGELTDSGLEAIKNWVYYLLHPTEGFTYVTTWLTNKLNHFLLRWHNDMTGTNGVGAITGSTHYKGNTGYVSMPDLSEIQWTNSLIGFYNNAIPFLIVIMIIVMLFAFITGTLKLQQSILGAVIFSVFLMMPVTLINGVVDISNRTTQLMYSDKFTYWALVQQESYASKIDEAANKAGSDGTSTYDNYLRTLLAENADVYSNQGAESIVLKWQAPRKFKAVGLSQQDASMMSGLSQTGKSLLMGALNGAYSGQTFTDNDSDTYLYRSYIDTANIARYTYNGIKSGNRKAKTYSSGVTSSSLIPKSKWTNSGLVEKVDHMDSEFKEYRELGFTGKTGDSSELNKTFYTTVPIASSIINDMLGDSKDKVKSMNGNISATDTKINKESKVGLDPDLFFFHIPMFNNSSYEVAGDEGFKNACATLGISEDSDRALELKDAMSGYSEQDLVALSAFALYSESPFYYFSWKLYNDGLEPSSSLVNGNYKDLVLKDNYFYNSNGGINDFMDMRSLFTYIIPYLKQCNNIVREWDNMYGCFLYEGVPTEEGRWSEVKDDPDMAQKYWHNLNVARLYSIYSPWVDILYDCSYAKETQIKAYGEIFTIADPLDPSKYPENRPMIFSEAEMVYMGLSSADLTQAERLIIAANKDMQASMYDLLNYYNFSDVTLDTAAAMNCTFAFNTAFTETGIFTDNKILYPQSFDLPSFSYDAFLRLIISNNTGESLLDTSSQTGTAFGNTTGDFYERVVNKSSMTTVLVMLLLDVLSIYVVPMLRIFFVIAIFISSILIVLSAAMKIEGNIKFITKVLTNFVMPLVKFLLVTIGFAAIISLFMGVGNNAVTLTNRNSIQMGDPVMAMLLMVVINVACIILYWRIISSVVRNMKSDFKNVRAFTSGALVGGVAVAAGGIANSIRSSINASKNADYQISGSSGGSGSGQVGTGEVDDGNVASRANARAARSLDRTADIDSSYRDHYSNASGSGNADGGYQPDSGDPTNYGHDARVAGHLGYEGSTEGMSTKERQEYYKHQQENLDNRVNAGTNALNNASYSSDNNRNQEVRNPSYRGGRSTDSINQPQRTEGYHNSQSNSGNHHNTNSTSNAGTSYRNPEMSRQSYDVSRNRGVETARPLDRTQPQRNQDTRSTVNNSQQSSYTRPSNSQVSQQSRQSSTAERRRSQQTVQKPVTQPTARSGRDDPNRSNQRAKGNK